MMPNDPLALSLPRRRSLGVAIAPAAEGFLDSRRNPRTRRAYDVAVRNLLRFLREEGSAFPAGVTRRTAERYRDRLVEAAAAGSCSTDTAYHRFAVAVRLFDDVVSRAGEGVVLQNPFRLVAERPPKPGRIGKTPLLRKEEVRQLLEAPDADTLVGLRDLVALYLMFNVGLRTNEIRGLRIGSVKKSGRHTVVDVVRKGMKDDVAKLPPYVAELVEAYVAELPIEEGPLLPSLVSTGRLREPLRPISAPALLRMVKRYGRRLGIAAERLKPHGGRVYMINEIVRRTGSVYRAQVAAGHASPMTTERYLRGGMEFDDAPVDYVRLPLPPKVRRRIEAG